MTPTDELSQLIAAAESLAALTSRFNDPGEAVRADPCPLCEYDNGKFIRLCGVHQQIETLRAERDGLKEENARLERILRRIDDLEAKHDAATWMEQCQAAEAEVARLTLASKRLRDTVDLMLAVAADVSQKAVLLSVQSEMVIQFAAPARGETP